MASDSIKCIISLLLLALAIHCGTSVRIPEEEEVPAVPAIAPEAPDDSDETPVPTVTPVATSPAVAPEAPDDSDETPVPTVTPAATSPAVAPEAPDDSDETPVPPVTPVTTAPAVAAGGASPDHTLTFFMHDILGGSNPSAIAVTGVVNNPAVNGQVPFAKPNGANLPVNSGVPVNNANSGVINNNNIPFLTGLSGTTPNVMQNNGNGNNNNANGGFASPLLNGQLPSGNALQKLMFGTITVFDDELTEGHELGSGLVGKAQGFYVASSEDGNSQTMAFTAMFESGGYVDSLSFFGVHRIGVSQSHLGIMGGTGKYVNAKGFATVKTFPAAINQHNTDGVETVLLITVYLTY